MEKIDKIFLGIVAFIFIILMIGLSYYGNPIGDESLPIGIAFRFVRGQTPFIDDLSPYIPLGLILTPLIKVSLFFYQGKDKLILFLRHLYLCSMLCIGFYVFCSVKKYLPSAIAFFIAICVAIFHPFNIHNFHYDTLGLALWSAIIFQFLNFTLQKEKTIIHFIFAVLNLLLCFSYPSFFILLLLLYLVFNHFILNKKLFWTSLGAVFSFAAIFMFFLIFYYYGVSYEDIFKTFQFLQGIAHYSIPGHSLFYKLISFKNIFLDCSGYIIFSFLLVGSSYLLNKIKLGHFTPHRKILIKIVFLSGSLLLPLVACNLTYAVIREPFYFFNCLGFLAAIIWLFYQYEFPEIKKLFLFIWIPAFFAGLLTSSSSSNLELNFTLGFFPTSLLSIIFVYIIISEQQKFLNLHSSFISIKTHPLIFYYTRFCFLYVFIMLGFFQMHYVYGEDKIGMDIYTQTKRYNVGGPFNGIHLNLFWIEKLKRLQEDIKKIDIKNNAGKYIYFGPLCGAYLLVDHLKPGEYLLFSFYHMDRFGLKMKRPGYSIFDKLRSSVSREQYEKIYLSGLPHQMMLSNEYYDIDYLKNELTKI